MSESVLNVQGSFDASQTSVLETEMTLDHRTQQLLHAGASLPIVWNGENLTAGLDSTKEASVNLKIDSDLEAFNDFVPQGSDLFGPP